MLTAPRITARAGESAQIKIGQDRSFTTSFRVVETNGAWEPVRSQYDLGVSVTVTGTPYPQDPERIRGTGFFRRIFIQTMRPSAFVTLDSS